jgi:hypothetical protein
MIFLGSALDALASVIFPAECRMCDQTLTAAAPRPFVDPVSTDCSASRRFVSGVDAPFGLSEAVQPPRPLCRLCRLPFCGFDRARSFS